MNKIKRWLVALGIGLTAACSASPPPVNKPAATVEVEMVWVGVGDGSATAWYIAGNEHFGVVATAGHVCEDFFVYTLSDGNVALPVGYDHDEAETDDVCLLFTLAPAPAVLELATTPAKVGDQVDYYGYPSGERAHFYGEVSAINDDGSVVVSIPGYYGASGSAIVRDGRVVGLLNTGHVDFGNLITATGLEALKKAKAAADEWLASDVP